MIKHNEKFTTESYSGTTGCMCGCKGKYNKSTRARSMMFNKLLKDSNSRLEIWAGTDCDGVAGTIFVETETRNNVLYLTPEGVHALRDLVKEHKQPMSKFRAVGAVEAGVTYDSQMNRYTLFFRGDELLLEAGNDEDALLAANNLRATLTTDEDQVK